MADFQQNYALFKRECHKLPDEIARKLQLMHDYIQNPKSSQNFTPTELDIIQDITQMNTQAVRLIFISIVKTILSPKMYCSFEKNCKIKIQGSLKGWKNAYITFEDQQSVTFNTFKKKLKFTLELLQFKIVKDEDDEKCQQKSSHAFQQRSLYDCNLQEMEQFERKQKKKKPMKIEFRYQGIRKLKIKFSNGQAGETFLETLSHMQSEINTKKTYNENLQKSKNLTQTMLRDYKEYHSSKQITFKVHKKEPKVHIELFMTGHFWDILNLVEFFVRHKLWNSKVREEKIYYHQSGFYFIERRFTGSNLVFWDRRTLTKLKFQKICDEKYYVQESVIDCIPSSKYIVVSEINIAMVLEILNPKIVKVTLQSTFNGGGYCRQVDSRNMLIGYFDDIISVNKKFSKLKEKGKIIYTMDLHKIYNQNSSPSYLNSSKLSLFNFIPVDDSQNHENKNIEDQIFYTITEKQDPDVEARDPYNNMGIRPEGRGNQKQEEQQFDEMIEGWDQQSDSTNKQNSRDDDYTEKVESYNMSKTEKKEYELKQDTRNSQDNCVVQMASNIMKHLKPKKMGQKIKLEYLKCLKEKTYENSYLKSHFSQENIQEFDQETPWYDPSILIPSAKEYQITPDKELIFINQELIQGQTDSLRFVIKQIGANLISGKSILNVSLPVDIFQSRSLLERASAGFSSVVKYLRGYGDADILTQIKAITGFQLSVPTLQLVMQKPFNPILGQTFQAYIEGIPIYWQQTSHHPPISSFYMKCNDFTMYGNLIPIANVSLNSGWGGNIGRTYIVMKNGNHFQISFPSAQISGLIYGQRKYALKNKAFIMNSEHRIFQQISICKESKGLYEYEKNEKKTKGDVLGGIFKVSQKFVQNFRKQKNLLTYEGLKKGDVEQKFSEIKGIWFQKMYLDQNQINKDKPVFGIEYFDSLLPSDSNYRLDVMMHRIGDLALSQKEKQVLETLQRNDRKLRNRNRIEKS